MGGINRENQGGLRSVEMLDAPTQRWYRLPDLTTQRWALAAQSIPAHAAAPMLRKALTRPAVPPAGRDHAVPTGASGNNDDDDDDDDGEAAAAGPQPSTGPAGSTFAPSPSHGEEDAAASPLALLGGWHDGPSPAT